ncbi:MAG: DUF4388 domain-containing protein [Gemmatimonadota bacterium]
MAIEGPLHELSLEDVLQLLELARKTGVLELSSDVKRDEAEVRLVEGMIVGANRRRSTRWIGRQLLRAGKLTERELERALEAQRREPDQRLGEILVEMGSLEREALEQHLRFQLEETVYELMGWTEGRFRFEERDEAASDAIQVSVRVDSLLMEGARRIDEWSRLESKVPDPGCVPVLAPADEGESEDATAPLDLRPDEWEVLAEIDGGRDVAQIAAALGRSTFDVAKIVYGLASTGVVQVRVRAESPAAPDRAAAVRGVEDALAAGDYDQALRLARDLESSAPDDVELVVLHGRALAAKQRMRAATEAFARAASLDPLAPEPRYRLGFVAPRTGELRRAADALESFLRLAPEDTRRDAARATLDALRTLEATLEDAPVESR